MVGTSNQSVPEMAIDNSFFVMSEQLPSMCQPVMGWPAATTSLIVEAGMEIFTETQMGLSLW